MEPHAASPNPAAAKKPRCIVYVDGFNFYYGVFINKPAWKWLNLQSFFEALRPDDDVVRIKYCTAVIDPDKKVSDRRTRQETYLKALATLPKVLRIDGRYQLRDETCRASQCFQGLKYKRPEEKKTDVNIAVEMIRDCMDEAVDRIVLISGDSDQEPALAFIRSRFPKVKAVVYIPVLPIPGQPRMNHYYRSIGVICGELPIGGIDKHQLPETIEHPSGQTITRPAEWA